MLGHSAASCFPHLHQWLASWPFQCWAVRVNTHLPFRTSRVHFGCLSCRCLLSTIPTKLICRSTKVWSYDWHSLWPTASTCRCTWWCLNRRWFGLSHRWTWRCRSPLCIPHLHLLPRAWVLPQSLHSPWIDGKCKRRFDLLHANAHIQPSPCHGWQSHWSLCYTYGQQSMRWRMSYLFLVRLEEWYSSCDVATYIVVLLFP